MERRADSGTVITWVLDSLAQFALAALLILPLFSVVYFDNWGSIDSTFIAHARFLVEHWPHPSWQPLWYGGTRFDYIYPPALPYGTAMLAMVLGIPIAQAYHLYTAILYSIGIAAVGLFVRYLSGSRVSGWIAAAATALVSPSVVLIRDIYDDAFHRSLAPQRLNVLVGWGEGPHISALALLPLALAACHWAVTRRSPLGVATASIACALVVSNNFYGSVTLAISYALLVWSLWVTRPGWRLLGSAAIVPVFSLGLIVFWLVPSYMMVTLRNLGSVQATGRPSGLLTAAVLGGLYLWASYRYAARRPERCYAVFVAGLALIFSTIVLGGYWFGLKVFGTPVRFSPEMDLALILVVLETVRRLAHRFLPALARSSWGAPIGAALSGVLLVGLSFSYLQGCWDIYPQDHHPEQRIEYQISDWIAEHLPGARVFQDGSVRFWANVWHDNPQLSGGSDQGMLNTAVSEGIWELRIAEQPGPSALWLRAFGVDAVVVNETVSEAIYRTFEHPRKFNGVLPVIFDNGKGDVIYQVPRRYPGLARVVRRSELSAVWEPSPVMNPGALEAYVAALEEGPAVPATLEWHGPEEIKISADFGEDQALLVQESYDPVWRAESDGKSLPIRPGPLGQMVILVPPGTREVVLRFGLPFENLVGQVVSGLSVIFLGGWIWADYWRRRRGEPAL